MRVEGIVAAVLHQIERRHADAHGLRKLRDQERRDLEVADADAPVGVAVEQRGGLGEPLGELHRAFLPPEAERADVAGILVQPVKETVRLSLLRKRGQE